MRRSVPLVLLLLAPGCGESRGAGPPLTHAGLRAVLVTSGVIAPTHIASPPDDDRLFVVEQAGRIRILAGGALREAPFLDIRERVGAGGERGLLSVAFHPDYATNGTFFVNYTDREGDTRIERFRVSSSPDLADAASGTLILTVAQPYANHNGGHILFGPDGFLYVGMGDGGSGGDPHGHGQNPATLLGALLRLDVAGAEPYAVPADNPFAGGGGRGEIWAIGLRNPWRLAFDPATGTLWVADVGQGAREEVNVVPASAAALNYGWNRYEGRACYREPCDPAGLTGPVHDYRHPDGCSITGGAVYRGSALPDLAGHYLYSDYCAGWIRSFRVQDGVAVDHRDWNITGLSQVTSFGVDRHGELYVATGTGRVYRLEPDR
ncbi:MAG TPA: PQQ-dependent sugar dehydrogenase [Longimicrobiales bacterium]|nr:PQQ-dependent sugar dehydrogenase [Longimicrobiales bacterium]